MSGDSILVGTSVLEGTSRDSVGEKNIELSEGLSLGLGYSRIRISFKVS